MSSIFEKSTSALGKCICKITLSPMRIDNICMICGINCCSKSYLYKMRHDKKSYFLLQCQQCFSKVSTMEVEYIYPIHPITYSNKTMDVLKELDVVIPDIMLTICRYIYDDKKHYLLYE